MTALGEARTVRRGQMAVVQRARWVLRERASQHGAYLAVARRRGRSVVTSATELVIEAFPRSASSFSVAAFQLAQPGRVRVAHHLHSVAHIRRAIALDVPTLVLVRNPEDAVLSTVIYSGKIQIPDAMAAYARFYEAVATLPARSVIVADFSDVTSDFGRVVDAVNRQFGTAFARFEHTRANLAEVASLLELSASYRRESGMVRPYLSGLAERPTSLMAPGAGENIVARPSAARGNAKAALREMYHERALARERIRVTAAYNKALIFDD